MARFSLSGFLSGAAAATAGHLQGKIQAQQEMERRRQQALDRESQYDQFVAATVLPDLDKGSPEYAKTLQNLTRRQFERSQGRLGSEYVQPGARGPFGGFQATGQPMDTGYLRAGAGALGAPGGQAAIAAPFPIPAPQAMPQAMPQAKTVLRPLPPGTQGPPMWIKGRPVPAVGGVTPQQATLAGTQALGIGLQTAIPGAIPSPATPNATPPAPPAARLFGALPSRAVPPPGTPTRQPVTPAPLGRHELQVPGYGTVQLRGVDPKEADALQKRIDKKRETLKNYVSKTPEEAQYLQELTDRAVDLRTEEGFKNAQLLDQQLGSVQFARGPLAQRFEREDFEAQAKSLKEGIDQIATLSEGDALYNIPLLYDKAEALRKQKGPYPVITGKLAGQGRAVQALKDAQAQGNPKEARRLVRLIQGSIGSTLTPAQEEARFSAIMSMMGKLPPEVANNPSIVRQAFAARKIGYMVDSLPDSALQFGGEALEKRWQRLLDNMQEMPKMNPAQRRLLFEELTATATLLHRTVPVTAEQLGQVDPVTQAKIFREKQIFDLRVAGLNERAKLMTLQIQRAQDVAKRFPFEIRKAEAQAKTAEAKADLAQRKQRGELDPKTILNSRWNTFTDAFRRYKDALKTAGLREGDVNLDNPAGATQRTIRNALQNAEEARTLWANEAKSRGINVDTLLEGRYDFGGNKAAVQKLMNELTTPKPGAAAPAPKRQYTAAELRAMPRAQRRAVLDQMAPKDVAKFLAE